MVLNLNLSTCFAFMLLATVAGSTASIAQESEPEIIKPVRSESIDPLRNETFNKNGTCRERKQGGNPRMISDLLVFDGATDGNRQVDPQIAVGGDHVLHATNNGLIIYTKRGEFIQGVSQNCFNGGIDPKLFYDAHNGVFGFDLWNPWDDAKQKPVNISVSETNDPTGAWNTYPVPAPGGVDGGGIGYSRKWIGYTFPGGETQTFVMKTEQAKSGDAADVFHFAGNLGHPVATQDEVDELYFVKLNRNNIRITRVSQSADGTPVASLIANAPHNFPNFGWPPGSPQKGTDETTASGDRNPKNIVLQGGFLWFSQTVNCDGRAAVQWHQVQLDGTFVQSGLIADETNSFIQTTVAVNKRLDLLVGFQETGPEMFISPRFAYRRADDEPGTLRETISLGNGQSATEGGAWGDYSGSVVDGDNLLDMWTIQSVADNEGRGDTVIAKLGESDWKSLFDGSTTDGWRDFKGDSVSGTSWIVEEGCLVSQETPGNIVTANEFVSFELTFDWQADAGANSGVFYRVDEGVDVLHASGLEFQVLDNDGHEDRPANEKAAACYGVIEPTYLSTDVKFLLNPAGEWNSGHVIVIDNRVEHFLNGVRVLAYEIGSEQYLGNVASGPLKDHQKLAASSEGNIALQNYHGHKVKFRNIRIREIRK